jgi:hypothetical protein
MIMIGDDDASLTQRSAAGEEAASLWQIAGTIYNRKLGSSLFRLMAGAASVSVVSRHFHSRSPKRGHSLANK